MSCTEKSISFFREILTQNSFQEIVALPSCSAARQLLIDREFDLCIINAPLPDESGEALACELSGKGFSQIIMVVKAENYDEISAKAEDYGVFTIPKPLNRAVFWSSLKLAGAAFNRMRVLEREKHKLLEKIDDIRLINRAKCLLIEHLGMSEQAAHKFIERQAMDMRMPKKEVAERILKTYGS